MIIKITQTATKQTNNDDCEKHIRLAAMIRIHHIMHGRNTWYTR